MQDLNNANPLAVTHDPKEITSYFLKTCAFKKDTEEKKSASARAANSRSDQQRTIAFKDAELAAVQQEERQANKQLDQWFASLDTIS